MIIAESEAYMDIKEYLKSIHMTQKELADRLGLSRPTLDTYIQMFQMDEPLPRDKYQVVFEQLFTKPLKGDKEFRETLDKYALFLKQEQVLGTNGMSTEASYIMSLVTQEIKKDLSKNDSKIDIYVFINLLICNYRKNPILMQLVEYFLLLYSRKKVTDIAEDDKVFLSNYHRLLQNKEKMVFQPKAFDDLLEYANKSKKVNAMAKEQIQQQMLQKLETKMKQLTDAGIDINSDEFDVSSILKL